MTAPEHATVQELLQRPVRSKLFHLFDILFDNILITADSLKSKGVYYLVITEDKAELVHISPELIVSSKDITNVIQYSANKRSFVYDDHKYIIYRKIK